MLFYRFIPLIALVFQLFLLFLVARVKAKRAVHWVFLVFLVAMSLWGFFIFGMRSSPNLAVAMVWEQALLPTFVVATYSFFFFTILFTRRTLSITTVLSIFVLAALLIVISPTPLILKGMQFRPYGFAPIVGPLWFSWIAGIYLALFASFYFLYRFHGSATSADDRNRSLYVLGGIAATFIGGTTDYVAALGLIPQPGGIYGNILFATLATVAVVRHKLVDAHLYLRRGVAYVLVGATVVVPYVILIVLLERIFRVREVPLAANITLILGIALGLHFLLRRFQEIVDRWFLGARYNALQTLREFSRTATQTLDSQELHSSLIQTMGSAMGTNIVHLLLYFPEKGSLGLAMSSRLDPQRFPSFQENSPLVLWLKHWEGVAQRESLAKIPVLQGLSKNSWQAISDLEGELFVPLKTGQRLVGLLVLGARGSRIPYGNEDINVLVTVSNQASMALENARLYSLERERVAELQALTQMKSGFLMTVAHQLKTPLSAIKASAGMLQEVIGPKATVSQKRLLANVDRGTHSLEMEIGKLLEFLKIKTAAVRLDVEAIDVRSIVSSAADQVLPSIKGKGQSLVLHMSESPIMAQVDRSKVESILLNLLGNANKFTPAGGKIDVNVQAADSNLTVEVCDTGQGIASDALEHLFEAFYEVKDQAASATGSSGLGLALTKSLVELHGGKIWVDSTPGEGSRFCFSLPLRFQGKPGYRASSPV
ncbi:MAG: GAF domain-containing protein [Chloroflexi bacterium]|nr:GAF domain-containing protein [Chloroflexota bacterium]